ncbi:MAG: diguanylate cyclase [Actinobacteria bacterium]|nr:MAG: diguanylate cyclase [Actinomycetota bacterium]
MKGEVDRGIVDQTAVGMRVATFSAGVWLTYVICVSSAIYAALTWDRPHRGVLVAAFGAGILGGLVAAQLPRERIVRSGFREAFFLGWSLLDLALIVLATWADGGTRSPLALIIFSPVVFAAMSYPLASVLAVGGLSVASYLTLAITVGGGGWAYEGLFAVMLACTGAMSAWQARNHDHQHGALMEVSRADPLTGCLNRRGFEERAMAEIGAATRRAGQGAVVVLDIDHFKPVNDRFGHAAGDELLRWVVETVKEVVRPNDAIGRIGGDEFAVLFADIDPADAVEGVGRMTAALSERAPCSLGLATFPMDGVELEDLMRLADVRLYASRHGRPDRDVTGPTERLSWAATLAHAVDMRMNAAHEHSRAVAELAVSIGTELGWQPDMLGMLRMAAMLHDIGKVTVPDEILCKPGQLTDQEFEQLKGHSVAGADLVSRIEGLDVIVAWIRHSHESFDGSGYPDGLRGEAIPQASRIMLVADAFDAITSTRPYREALSVEHACTELKRHAGGQFDSACVQALLDHLSAAPANGSVHAAVA